ncbi:MAG: flagellar hook-length control protein FliK, partial [Pseudobutyrivibrio sp.]|nr:flagellar hook-length control protein FliK [Pseudobutyrivibrio sp.]
MHISNNGFNQYQNIANGLEAATNNKMATTSTATVISDLKQGTIFEGSVSSVDNGKVTINLSNGQSVYARLDAGVSIEEGQSLFFEVKNNDGVTVQIKPISNGLIGNPILLNALNTAGISVNDKSLAMVNTMMQEQLPIGTDSLLAM